MGRPVDVRPLGTGDGPLLARATLGNLNWSGPRFTAHDVARRPDFEHYTHLVPARGDFGFAAEPAGPATEPPGEPVGVGWAQLLTADDPGYGFVDASTPEVSLWVAESWRGHGVGRTLLRRLQAEAVARGHTRLSLSVEAGNRAARLYAAAGFEAVPGRAADGVMVWRAPTGLSPQLGRTCG